MRWLTGSSDPEAGLSRAHSQVCNQLQGSQAALPSHMSRASAGLFSFAPCASSSSRLAQARFHSKSKEWVEMQKCMVKFLLVSHLLSFPWPKELTWLSPKSIYGTEYHLHTHTHTHTHRVRGWCKVTQQRVRTQWGGDAKLHSKGYTCSEGVMQSYTAKGLGPGRGKELSPSVNQSLTYRKELANIDCRRERNYKTDQIYWKESKISNYEDIKQGY